MWSAPRTARSKSAPRTRPSTSGGIRRDTLTSAANAANAVARRTEVHANNSASSSSTSSTNVATISAVPLEYNGPAVLKYSADHDSVRDRPQTANGSSSSSSSGRRDSNGGPASLAGRSTLNSTSRASAKWGSSGKSSNSSSSKGNGAGSVHPYAEDLRKSGNPNYNFKGQGQKKRNSQVSNTDSGMDGTNDSGTSNCQKIAIRRQDPNRDLMSLEELPEDALSSIIEYCDGRALLQLRSIYPPSWLPPHSLAWTYEKSCSPRLKSKKDLFLWACAHGFQTYVRNCLQMDGLPEEDDCGNNGGKLRAIEDGTGTGNVIGNSNLALLTSTMGTNTFGGTENPESSMITDQLRDQQKKNEEAVKKHERVYVESTAIDVVHKNTGRKKKGNSKNLNSSLRSSLGGSLRDSLANFGGPEYKSRYRRRISPIEFLCYEGKKLCGFEYLLNRTWEAGGSPPTSPSASLSPGSPPDVKLRFISVNGVFLASKFRQLKILMTLLAAADLYLQEDAAIRTVDNYVKIEAKTRTLAARIMEESRNANGNGNPSTNGLNPSESRSLPTSSNRGTTMRALLTNENGNSNQIAGTAGAGTSGSAGSGSAGGDQPGQQGRRLTVNTTDFFGWGNTMSIAEARARQEYEAQLERQRQEEERIRNNLGLRDILEGDHGDGEGNTDGDESGAGGNDAATTADGNTAGDSANDANIANAENANLDSGNSGSASSSATRRSTSPSAWEKLTRKNTTAESTDVDACGEKSGSNSEPSSFLTPDAGAGGIPFLTPPLDPMQNEAMTHQNQMLMQNNMLLQNANNKYPLHFYQHDSAKRAFADYVRQMHQSLQTLKQVKETEKRNLQNEIRANRQRGGNANGANENNNGNLNAPGGGGAAGGANHQNRVMHVVHGISSGGGAIPDNDKSLVRAYLMMASTIESIVVKQENGNALEDGVDAKKGASTKAGGAAKAGKPGTAGKAGNSNASKQIANGKPGNAAAQARKTGFGSGAARNSKMLNSAVSIRKGIQQGANGSSNPGPNPNPYNSKNSPNDNTKSSFNSNRTKKLLVICPLFIAARDGLPDVCLCLCSFKCDPLQKVTTLAAPLEAALSAGGSNSLKDLHAGYADAATIVRMEGNTDGNLDRLDPTRDASCQRKSIESVNACNTFSEASGLDDLNDPVVRKLSTLRILIETVAKRKQEASGVDANSNPPANDFLIDGTWLFRHASSTPLSIAVLERLILIKSCERGEIRLVKLLVQHGIGMQNPAILVGQNDQLMPEAYCRPEFSGDLEKMLYGERCMGKKTATQAENTRREREQEAQREMAENIRGIQDRNTANLIANLVGIEQDGEGGGGGGENGNNGNAGAENGNANNNGNAANSNVSMIKKGRRDRPLTPIHAAVVHQHRKICNYLLNHHLQSVRTDESASPEEETKDPSKRQSVSFTRQDQEAAVDENDYPPNVLLEEINICLSSGKSALHVACENGDALLVKMLLQRHASLDVVTCSGRSPLFSAVEHSHEAVVNMICCSPQCDVRHLTMRTAKGKRRDMGPQDRAVSSTGVSSGAGFFRSAAHLRGAASKNAGVGGAFSGSSTDLGNAVSTGNPNNRNQDGISPFMLAEKRGKSSLILPLLRCYHQSVRKRFLLRQLGDRVEDVANPYLTAKLIQFQHVLYRGVTNPFADARPDEKPYAAMHVEEVQSRLANQSVKDPFSVEIPTIVAGSDGSTSPRRMSSANGDRTPNNRSNAHRNSISTNSLRESTTSIATSSVGGTSANGALRDSTNSSLRDSSDQNCLTNDNQVVQNPNQNNGAPGPLSHSGSSGSLHRTRRTGHGYSGLEKKTQIKGGYQRRKELGGVQELSSATSSSGNSNSVPLTGAQHRRRRLAEQQRQQQELQAQQQNQPNHDPSAQAPNNHNTENEDPSLTSAKNDPSVVKNDWADADWGEGDWGEEGDWGDGDWDGSSDWQETSSTDAPGSAGGSSNLGSGAGSAPSSDWLGAESVGSISDSGSVHSISGCSADINHTNQKLGVLDAVTASAGGSASAFGDINRENVSVVQPQSMVQPQSVVFDGGDHDMYSDDDSD